MLLINKIFIFLLCLTLLLGCKNNSEIPIPPDHSSYFPFDQTQRFMVRQITIDAPLNYYDTVEYLMDIYVDSVFNSHDAKYGHYSMYKVDEDMTPLGFLEREISAPVGSYIEKYDNCRMVKSLLPVRDNASWNPYVYCMTTDVSLYSKIRKAHLPGTVQEFLYDSILHIVHNYDSSLIQLKVNQEIWAAGHGLVYSEVTEISSNTSDLDFTKPIRERIVTGTIYEMTRIIP